VFEVDIKAELHLAWQAVSWQQAT